MKEYNRAYSKFWHWSSFIGHWAGFD